MIGIDTNVLVRLAMRDDVSQAATAEKFVSRLTRDDPGFVSLVTMLETVWTLDRTYKQSPSSIARFVYGLLSAEEIVVQAPDVVRRGMSHAIEGNAGFADAVIGLLGIDADCDYTVTFDRRAAALPGMLLLDG